MNRPAIWTKEPAPRHRTEELMQLMADAKAGAPLPAVGEALLRKTWSMFPASKDDTSVNSREVWAEVGAVAFTRCGVLCELLWAGELAAWQHGERELDDFVFREAAVFPYSNEQGRPHFLAHLHTVAQQMQKDKS